MVKIILIDDGTKRDNNNLGDVVSIHDNMELGNGYNTFKIVEVSGTVEQIRAELEKKIPKIKNIDGKKYYVKNEKNIEIKEFPKYSLNITNAKKDETLTTLSNKIISNLISLNKDSVKVS